MEILSRLMGKSRPPEPPRATAGNSELSPHVQTALQEQHDEAEVITNDIAPAMGPWSGTIGRAGSRAAQFLLLLLAVGLVVWLLLYVKLVVIAFIIALIFASAVAPMTGKFIHWGWSNLWATVVSFLVILMVIGGVIYGIVAATLNQLDDLVASAADGWQALQDQLQRWNLPFDKDQVDQWVQEASKAINAAAVGKQAVTGLSAASQFLTGLVLMIVILFFFLKDGRTIWNFVLRWFHGERRAKMAESGRRTVQVLGGYVRGTAMVAAVDAVGIGAGLVITGVPLAIPLTVLVFMGAFIPIIGATLTGAIAILVALVSNGPTTALIILAVVLAVQQLESNILQPKIMGNTLSLHPLVILMALPIGTIVGGVVGAVLSVPVSAVGWAVIQVWTTQYQHGFDPQLGADPVKSGDEQK